MLSKNRVTDALTDWPVDEGLRNRKITDNTTGISNGPANWGSSFSTAGIANSSISVRDSTTVRFGDGSTYTGEQLRKAMGFLMDKFKEECPEEFV